MCLRSNIVYKITCGRCDATYYGETCHHFKVIVGEHSSISPLTNKRSKSKKSIAVKDHMLICDQPVSFDYFKVLASNNSEFHLKIKESLFTIFYILMTIHFHRSYIAIYFLSLSITKYMLQWALKLYLKICW